MAFFTSAPSPAPHQTAGFIYSFTCARLHISHGMIHIHKREGGKSENIHQEREGNMRIAETVGEFSIVFMLTCYSRFVCILSQVLMMQTEWS